MTTLDRQLFVNYLRSYLIVLSCLLGLYVIVDLFMNLDDFSQGTFRQNVVHMAKYYSAQVFKIFDLLTEVITLAAAVFTIAWLQRNNELLPQLSAGVPTRRVVRPVLLGVLLTLALGPLNKDVVIPTFADELITPRDDPKRERAVEVRGGFDSTGIHLEGYQGFRAEKKVIGLFVTLPATGPIGLAHLSAKEAVYVPPTGAAHTGGWILYQTTPELTDPLPPNVEQLGYGKYFLYTREMDFDAISRRADWYTLASTPALRQLLAHPDPRRQPQVAVEFHRRLVRPLVGAVMALLGLAVILRDQNRHVFINAGLTLVLVFTFYVVVLGCKYLGDVDLIAPPLAAWLPILLFGPMAIVWFDAVHT